MITDVKKLQEQLAKWKHRALVAEAKCASVRDPRWHILRAAHLKKESDCQACGTTESLEVHHCIPVHVSKKSEMKPKNLITLCESKGHLCHLRIGHGPRGDPKPSWKKINPFVREDAAAALAKVKK